MERTAAGFAEAEGSCLGEPKIKAGSTIEIKGVGSKFSGKYVVTSVTHVLRSPGTFKTFFTIAGRSDRGLLDLMNPPEERIWGQQLVIGPYMHIPWVRKTGEVDFGPEADNRADERQLRWFDRWLKGAPNGAEKDPAVRVFVMGAHTWREAADWPIPGTRFTKYYLHSYGTANSSNGNGGLSTEAPRADEPADRFRYDPADPVPSRGGHSCCFAELAVNFFVQGFMLPCCAIAFNDFSGTNIGMGFRSVITDTDCYIVMERANRCRVRRRRSGNVAPSS